MYGIQTQATLIKPHTPFENDVKMYGIQTTRSMRQSSLWFENDVKMYGIQTASEGSYKAIGLRMM